MARALHVRACGQALRGSVGAVESSLCSLGTAAVASSQLGITIEAEPLVDSSASLSSSDDSDDDDSRSMVVVAGIAGGVGGLALLVIVVGARCCTKKKAKKRKLAEFIENNTTNALGEASSSAGEAKPVTNGDGIDVEISYSVHHSRNSAYV